MTRPCLIFLFVILTLLCLTATGCEDASINTGGNQIVQRGTFKIEGLGDLTLPPGVTHVSLHFTSGHSVTNSDMSDEGVGSGGGILSEPSVPNAGSGSSDKPPGSAKSPEPSGGF